MWGSLGLAQVGIQISPILNNFWSSKWKGFILCGRLSPLVLLSPWSFGAGALRMDLSDTT